MAFSASIESAVLSPNNVFRLNQRHAPELERLETKYTYQLFGTKPARTHLNEHYLTMGLRDTNDEMLAAISLDSYPNVPSLPPWEWNVWLHNLYDISDLTPRNALWCHYAVYDRRYATLFLRPILQNFFTHHEEMEKVVFVCPPGIARVEFLEHIAVRCLPKGFVNPRTVQTLYVLKKRHFVCAYTIRGAVEEDNDDLVAIIPKIVADHYGPYYIAELLSLEETGRRIIVAEHRGLAVGVLVLNEVVNYELLNENFELIVYNGLRKQHEDDEIMAQSLSNAGFSIWDEGDQSMASGSDHLNMDQQSKSEDQVDTHSEDDYSLFNISSSLLLRYLYDDKEDDTIQQTKSNSSKEREAFGDEDYADHIYKAAYEHDTSTMKLAPKYVEESPIPIFYGDANAFTLEICAGLPDHETCLYLLCQAAFECFPDREYCVVSFPTSNSCPYLTKHFGRVMARNNSVFEHDLYVLHRNAILGELSVRVAVMDDCAAVERLVEKFPRINVWEIFEQAITGRTYEEDIDDTTSTTSNQTFENALRAYVLLCEDQIVGCAVLNEEKDIEYLKLHYWIESWANLDFNKFGAFGTIECFLLSPIFQRQQAFYIRELHRLSSFYVLFYRLMRYDFILNFRLIPIVNAITTMAPVMVRTRITYSPEMHEQFDFFDAFSDKQTNFALYMTTTRLMSRPIIEINERIVIVGAGKTAMAFLESLLFCKNSKALIFFTNLIIISPYDVFELKSRKLDHVIFVKTGTMGLTDKEYLWLKTYVYMYIGVMTSINRSSKYVTINDESYVPYDYLFLLCGEQFQKPPLSGKRQARKPKSDLPNNVFIINTSVDVAQAFHIIKTIDATKKGTNGTIVVFGHYLEALCCLTALLEAGIPGSSLVYVDPSPESNPSNSRHDHLSQFFNNSMVENAVLEELLLTGITVYQDYNIVDWYYENENDNWVTSVKFESKYKFIEIELAVLFVFHSRTISPRTFLAIIRAGLVFNGQLVIDREFRTNDPNIFSAGPITKYSQRYHAEDEMHKYYNSTEIGYQLGRRIRDKLIPEMYKDYPSQREPLYNMPIVQFCRFPGNIHYLQVSKPGRPIPLEVAMNKGNYGKVLITGNTHQLESQGYFRLHFNQFNSVETITCLSKKDINLEHLIALYGKHESFFNNLMFRYETKMVTDLFVYFEQAWMYAIFHSEFNDLMRQCSKLFKTITTPNGTTLIDELHKLFEENSWTRLDKQQCDEFKALSKRTDLYKAIEKKVLCFLDVNLTYLPMYAHHILIQWIIGCNRHNALFHENRDYGEFLPNTYLKRKKKYQSVDDE